LTDRQHSMKVIRQNHPGIKLAPVPRLREDIWFSEQNRITLISNDGYEEGGVGENMSSESLHRMIVGLLTVRYAHRS